jgi:hypothetical protein
MEENQFKSENEELLEVVIAESATSRAETPRKT